MINTKTKFYLAYLSLFLSQIFLCVSFIPKVYFEDVHGMSRLTVMENNTPGNVILFFVLPFIIGLLFLFLTLFLKKKSKSFDQFKKATLVFAIVFSILNFIGLLGTALTIYGELTSSENYYLLALNAVTSVSILSFSTFWVWRNYKKVSFPQKESKTEIG